MLTQFINARIPAPQGWLKNGSVLIRDGQVQKADIPLADTIRMASKTNTLS